MKRHKTYNFHWTLLRYMRNLSARPSHTHRGMNSHEQLNIYYGALRLFRALGPSTLEGVGSLTQPTGTEVVQLHSTVSAARQFLRKFLGCPKSFPKINFAFT